MTHPSHPSAYPQQPPGEPHTVPFPVQQQWAPADVRYALPPEAGAAVPAPAQEPAATAPKAGGRDRYLDLLRAVALVRVVVYHLFGWAWLTILFPSMGVMFALAGS